MNIQGITIFTEPVPQKKNILDRIKLNGSNLIKQIIRNKVYTDFKKYGGHYAVTRSLIEGLKGLDINFNYNPKPSATYNVVIVLAGIEELKLAIEKKRKGEIKFLLTGPNIVEHVRDFNYIVCDKSVDQYIAPSEWVKNLVISDCIGLQDKTLIWPAGIDTNFWKPTFKPQRKTVIIYKKTESIAFQQEIIDLVKSRGFIIVEIEYKNYNAKMFKKALNNAKFAIFISRSESQGIALLETWAMNVPTLVFNPEEFEYFGLMRKNISACPYLTSATGKDWKTTADLSILLNSINNELEGFKPREYVVKNFSDQIAALNLVSKIKELNNYN